MNAVLENQPLKELDEWDDFVATRYKQVNPRRNFVTTRQTRIPR